MQLVVEATGVANWKAFIVSSPQGCCRCVAIMADHSLLHANDPRGARSDADVAGLSAHLADGVARLIHGPVAGLNCSTDHTLNVHNVGDASSTIRFDDFRFDVH